MESIYGLEVMAMPNALKGVDYLYRHPEARAADFMEAFRDPEIKAVFNAIGGDDTPRTRDRAGTAFRWLCGCISGTAGNFALAFS